MSTADALFRGREAVSCTWGRQSTFCAVKLKGRALQWDVQIWMGRMGNTLMKVPESPRREVVRSSAGADAIHPPFWGSFA